MSFSTPTRTVYVGNIPYSATEETLLQAFAEYEPAGAKIVAGKGVAFIEVPAKKAYAMVRDTDGSKLEGRLLSVSMARPRANEPTVNQDQFREQEAKDQARSSGPPQRYDNREQRPNRPYRDRYEGNRPQEDRPQEDRPQGDRPQGDRPRGDRPQGDRPYGNRPYGNRPQGDRPYRDRPQGDRPYNRPPSDRPYGNRPPQDRPYGNRGGDRPPYRRDDRPGSSDSSDRPPRPYGDRDAGRPPFRRDDRPNRPPYQNRDRGEGAPSDRPADDRGPSGRPPYGQRPDYRSNDDRPRRYGDRPYNNGPRPDRPDRPPYRGRDDRPNRPPYDRRPNGGAPYAPRGDRPRFEKPPEGNAPTGDGSQTSGERPQEARQKKSYTPRKFQSQGASGGKKPFRPGKPTYGKPRSGPPNRFRKD